MLRSDAGFEQVLKLIILKVLISFFNIKLFLYEIFVHGDGIVGIWITGLMFQDIFASDAVGSLGGVVVGNCNIRAQCGYCIIGQALGFVAFQVSKLLCVVYGFCTVLIRHHWLYLTFQNERVCEYSKTTLEMYFA
jgi:hypothetical protein